MKERPILFNAQMVRAILEGRKTQTRRVMKMPHGLWETSPSGELVPIPANCPYGQLGDRLWVRETWGTGGYFPYPYAYRADGKEYPGERWRPSIHMPRRACRIVLEITDVHVERLHAISEADATNEGVDPAHEPNELRWQHYSPHGVAFARLWDSINGNGAWDANPWVWVVSFKQVAP